MIRSSIILRVVIPNITHRVDHSVILLLHLSVDLMVIIIFIIILMQKMFLKHL